MCYMAYPVADTFLNPLGTTLVWNRSIAVVQRRGGIVIPPEVQVLRVGGRDPASLNKVW